MPVASWSSWWNRRQNLTTEQGLLLPSGERLATGGIIVYHTTQ
jgi:hypothetical protein